ncbi:L,D-transpeptidase-like protein [Amycolatopsis sulphurea]|uniref:L,D-transpeptidase-like protein n=1 Tax=Amycolatopsis sulphurea TaxID=76022 RepID=A0A2A9FD25_9PSEU|nr:L,D-transpeptidase [Amycolatopsis sulphurea]PFG48696.1 L,D-transpeptidase-like protein [Amycolatopsis sulphurea]
MKRLLAGAVVMAAGFALAACSGGAPGSSGNGAAAAGASVPGTSATTAPPSSTTAPPSSTTSTSTPTNTSAKPKPQPKAQPVSIANVPCANAAAASGTSACVDISAHQAWLLQDGKISYGPVPMLPGRKGNPTPVGTFHVLSKEKLHLSREFDNAPMPNSVFFYPGDAFHTGSLRTYSHGCVHLSATASLRFFTALRTGDVVQVVA